MRRTRLRSAGVEAVVDGEEIAAQQVAQADHDVVAEELVAEKVLPVRDLLAQAELGLAGGGHGAADAAARRYQRRRGRDGAVLARRLQQVAQHVLDVRRALGLDQQPAPTRVWPHQHQLPVPPASPHGTTRRSSYSICCCCSSSSSYSRNIPRYLFYHILPVLCFGRFCLGKDNFVLWIFSHSCFRTMSRQDLVLVGNSWLGFV